MADWFRRLFGNGGSKDREIKAPGANSGLEKVPAVNWIAADQNPWHVPLLDVRPVTLGMLSTSTNPQCAANAISFNHDDGTSFVGVRPSSDRSVAADLHYPIDRYLADGWLFSPSAMEHKLAIYFHQGQIIFIRSWLRQVSATAELEISGNAAVIRRINGALAGENDDEFTLRVADFLIRTHVLGMRFPAPIPEDLTAEPQKAAMWCFSCFGKMAEFATPHRIEAPFPSAPLRTNSLLHIAVARNNSEAIIAELDKGVPIDLLAQDGLAPLHWSQVNKEPAVAELLLSRGSPVDVRSAEGATPLMNAVQEETTDWVTFLLARGADPNAADNRGFTALHRAAEMGKSRIVRILLDAGARDVEADGHTALSLAKSRNETEIVAILTEGRPSDA